MKPLIHSMPSNHLSMPFKRLETLIVYSAFCYIREPDKSENTRIAHCCLPCLLGNKDSHKKGANC